jgi:Protein of unknown function (DUF2809)
MGLLTKTYSGIGCEFVHNYLGGIIYVVFFIILTSVIFPGASSLKISLLVLGFTCTIEFSQLIQNDVLKSLRTHFLIRTLIGSVFNVFDFIFYFVGAAIGYGILMILNKEK